MDVTVWKLRRGVNVNLYFTSIGPSSPRGVCIHWLMTIGYLVFFTVFYFIILCDKWLNRGVYMVFDFLILGSFPRVLHVACGNQPQVSPGVQLIFLHQ